MAALKAIAQTFRIITKLEPYTETAGMNLTRRAILGVVKYPNILDLSSPQYAQLPHAENADPRYVKISDWKPGKGLFRDDVTMFTWLLQNLSENDRHFVLLISKSAVKSCRVFKNTI